MSYLSVLSLVVVSPLIQFELNQETTTNGGQKENEMLFLQDIIS